MKSPSPFLSWLASHFERFVAVKRAGGAGCLTQRRLLVQFDRYLCAQAAQPPLTGEIQTQWLASCEPTPRARNNLVSVVWQALAHARRHGAEVERLPERPLEPPRYWRLRPPRIVSPDERGRLLEAAHQLPPVGQWRGVSIATLLGLHARRRWRDRPRDQPADRLGSQGPGGPVQDVRRVRRVRRARGPGRPPALSPGPRGQGGAGRSSVRVVGRQWIPSPGPWRRDSRLLVRSDQGPPYVPTS